MILERIIPFCPRELTNTFSFGRISEGARGVISKESFPVIEIAFIELFKLFSRAEVREILKLAIDNEQYLSREILLKIIDYFPFEEAEELIDRIRTFGYTFASDDNIGG